MSSRRSTQRNNVDLPDPDAPMRTTHLVLGDVEIDAVENVAIAVTLDQAPDRQDLGHSAPWRVAARRDAQSASLADGTARATKSSPATTYGVKL